IRCPRSRRSLVTGAFAREAYARLARSPAIVPGGIFEIPTERTMMKLTTLAITSLLSGGLASTAYAVDQTVPGAGNTAAAQLAQSSALVSSARQFISKRISQIGDNTLRSNVHDLVEVSDVCIRHRANETAATKQAVIDALAAAGLFSATDGAAFPGGA